METSSKQSHESPFFVAAVDKAAFIVVVVATTVAAAVAIIFTEFVVAVIGDIVVAAAEAEMEAMENLKHDTKKRNLLKMFESLYLKI